MKRIPMLSLRLVRERGIPYRTRTIESSPAAYALFKEMADFDREAMWVACLDTKNRATCVSQVSLGTLNSAPASPREILKVAVLANAHGIIVAHNHPSGDPEPSPEDRRLTLRIRDAAGLLGIKLLDHLIIGEASYHSFADKGGL